MIGRAKLGALLAVGALATTVVLGGALATPATSLAAPEAVPVEQRGFPGPGGGQDTYLADALGITAAELTAAEQKAYELAVQKALDEGLITQAQADALKNRGGARGLEVLLHPGGDSDIDGNALLAEALGISPEQLDAARQKAMDARVAQAVTDGRITQEQADMMKAEQALRTYIQEKGFYADAVKQAVADGVITQEQADAILTRSFGMREFGMGDFHGRDRRGGFDRPMMRPGFGGPSTNGTGTSQFAPSNLGSGWGA